MSEDKIDEYIINHLDFESGLLDEEEFSEIIYNNLKNNNHESNVSEEEESDKESKD